ncbi:hypothetical protein Nepgr_029710 [Nepenthes gracilis]|uniref:Uncharacterized protein n=1 Tax=Nepenthes gracilis TaxID=150966 RepID=A0AAD3Y390_NEPGR|nr:hypothetical protein Nepgr_029710 [Nepenthes gracilis]
MPEAEVQVKYQGDVEAIPKLCVEVKHDVVLPSKIFLSKCFAIEEESVVEVEVEVELPSKQSRRGHNSALCHSQSVSRPMGRNLKSRGTPVPPSMDRMIEVQQNGPRYSSDLGQSDLVMRSKVPGESMPYLNQPELGSITEGVCIEAPCK